MAIEVPSDWYSSGVAITCGFETTGDPYEMVAGDFDGMGISCGALQWNIGMKSLQPMVLAVGEAKILSLMSQHGAEMWKACSSSITQGLSIVRSWQSNRKLRAKPKAELGALMGSAEMRAEQDRRLSKVAKIAMEMATDWAKKRDDTEPDKRLYCWFFDLATQNGSLEGQTPKKVADFIMTNKPDKVDDLICDYLENLKGASGHVKDAKKNGTLWRNPNTAAILELLCLTYLRSATANPIWRHVVINRKGSIAMGGGWVNSGIWDFSTQGL